MVRPTKYKKELAEQLLKILSKGLTKQEAAAELKISRDTLYRWAKEYEEFGEALKVGVEWSEAVNISILRQGALGQIPKFNPTAYALYMNNTFHWSRENSGGGNTVNIQNMNVLQTLPTAELEEKLRGYLTQYKVDSLADLRDKALGDPNHE